MRKNRSEEANCVGESYHRDMRQSVKKKDKYPLAKHHIAASAVSVKGTSGSPWYTPPSPPPPPPPSAFSLLTTSSSSRSSSRRAEGVPHHAAGRMELRRRAKSQGCQGRGTLRTTATRGCRREALLAMFAAGVFRLRGVGAAAATVLESERVDVSFAGVRVGEDGTEEARL